MNTTEAINRFKNGCCLPINKISRRVAIEHQNQSNIWQINDGFGLIRIMKTGNESTIVAYSKINNLRKIVKKPFESVISNEIYFDLLKLYKEGV